jgi:predicted restriction endonuclease
MDRLFDRGLISFTDDGKILTSSFLDNNTERILGVKENLQIQIEKNHLRYLSYHREYIFETKG